MAASVAAGRGERRSTPRFDDAPGCGVQKVQIRPGHRAMVINISAAGALIETTRQVLPGSTVELLVDCRQERTTVRARVLRSTVARVLPTIVCYRSAIVFERSLPWFVEPRRGAAADTVL